MKRVGIAVVALAVLGFAGIGNAAITTYIDVQGPGEFNTGGLLALKYAEGTLDITPGPNGTSEFRGLTDNHGYVPGGGDVLVSAAFLIDIQGFGVYGVWLGDGGIAPPSITGEVGDIQWVFGFIPIHVPTTDSITLNLDSDTQAFIQVRDEGKLDWKVVGLGCDHVEGVGLVAECVPEPASIVLWSLLAVAGVVVWRRRAR